MKRLFLLPVLIFGFSLACDQPYEEIEGIKIGCPYIGDLSKGTLKEDDERVTLYEYRLENSFFDSAEIEVVEGKIEGLSLLKIFNNLEALKRDRGILLGSLDKKWGEGVVIGDNEGLIVYVNKKPNSEYLGSIMVLSSFIESAGIFRVAYTSKLLTPEFD
ncbi:hypothetical protein MMG00_05635 [Ignatzschineria rhizosphaerae]|uniref:Lipoprotein n=1 Tax=Ignatzschineria rhizosphaerae TaxID=2923279 RepID=A0ABY3X608_9GAMM|nr:hypothetical protein [Ignatzschineria rhizosphaerae]UNM97330.1 hypothetical protein MMG00_05635 [Ignatzschineria rhizosphaerae]